MKKETLAYLAGIMDADGFFTIKRNTYSVRIKKDSHNPTYQERVGIKQVCPEAIDIIHKNFGGYRRIDKPSAKNGKPLHSLGLSCRKAVAFINAIYPYLRIKKKQARILLRLRKSIDKGKQKTTFSYHKNRWGKIAKIKRKSLSAKQVEYRENLINRLNTLNDTRAIKEQWRK